MGRVMHVKQRCLNETEKDYWELSGKYRNAEFAVEYKGDVDQEALKKALFLLSEKYPVLRASICEDSPCGSGYAFYLSEGNYPEFVVLDGTKERMFEYSRLRKKGRFHSKGQNPTLVHLVLVRSRDEGYVMIGFHHALFTAAQIHTYVSELFRMYTLIVNDRDVECASEPFPVSPDELLTNQAGLTEVARKRRSSDLDKGTLRCLGSEDVFKLGRSPSYSLFETARKLDVKVPSLVGSVLILALMEKCTLADRSSVQALFPIDWTRRVKKNSNVTTSAVTSHLVEVDADKAPNLESIAKDIDGKISAIESPGTSNLGRMPIEAIDDPDVSLNNQGRFPTFPHPDDLEFTEFTPFTRVKEWRDDKYEKLIYAPQHGIPKVALVFYTFDGQVNFWCQVRNDIDVAVVDEFKARIGMV